MARSPIGRDKLWSVCDRGPCLGSRAGSHLHVLSTSHAPTSRRQARRCRVGGIGGEITTITR